MAVSLGGVGLLLLAFGDRARAYQTGPPLDRVALCNAGPSCWEVDCHDSFRIDSGTAVLDLGLGGGTPGPLPATYRYGSLYRLRQPTPNIIEAAMALYSGHSVSEISRSDASAINLSQTSDAISEIIRTSKEQSQKS